MMSEHKAGIAAMDVTKDTSMKMICIEGNIGAGKSTLSKQLAEQMGAQVFYEPTDDNPYLDRYYHDPKRYALEMQFWLMSKRFEMHEVAIRHIWSTGQSVIMDRSIYGDWLFAKKNWEDGNIDNAGYESYLHHRDVMTRYLLTPHVMLFLEALPETCMDRIKERGRDCEKTIPLEYLYGLNRLHREFATEMEEMGSTVIRLDWGKYGDVSKVLKMVQGL